LDRTTNASGPVSAHTAEELAQADAGYHFGADEKFPFRGQGHGIPRLSQLLSRCPAIPIVVEIKGDDRRVADRVIDIVLESRAAERVVIGGFSHEVLTAVRQRLPDLTTSASAVEVQSALRRSYLRLSPRRTGYGLFQVPMTLRGRQVLTRPFVRVLVRARIPVHAWIVNEIADMHMLLEWGVSGLISDRPDRAVEVVRGLRP
jgi:glycerophosphoryl diester phosphodiesterase